MMRTTSLAHRTLAVAVFGCAAGAAACSVTVKTQTKYTAQPVTKTMAWDGVMEIHVENSNGTVTVTPSADGSVSLSATPFAFADNETDGSAANGDAASTVQLVQQSGYLYASCGKATANHGSAAIGTTGCDLAIAVPAGSATQPVTVRVTAHNGPASATDLTGTVVVHSDNGDAQNKVTPVKGSDVEASTANGGATLMLPSSFAADKIAIVVGNGSYTSDFSDVTKTTTSRGAAGTGAASVVVSSENGNVALKWF